MNTFKYTCYRELIDAYATSQGTSFRSLASAAQIHSSYFSRVMRSNADFSAEQLFKLAKAMQLQEHEVEYFLLLGEFSRSAHAAHKTFVRKKIQALQADHLKLSGQLQGIETVLDDQAIEIYFGDIRLAKVHMLLTIPRFKQNPQHIARRLHLSETELKSILDKLTRIGLIVWRGEAIESVKPMIHVDENHPISLSNHKNWRIDCLYQLNNQDPKPHDYHLSASFTCEEETKGKIKELLKDAIIAAQRLITQSKRSEDLFVLIIDLF